MSVCAHEAPPRPRQIKATPLPSAGESRYAACVHCGAPLHVLRDTAVLTGWHRAEDGWRVSLGPDEFPEWYTRDGLPPDE